jgi:hypothetical protein
MTKLTDAQLLAEVEDLLRTMPERFELNTPDIFSWLGRASAVIKIWDPSKEASFAQDVDNTHSNMAHPAYLGKRKVQTMLHQARHDLRLRTVGPLTVAVDQGAVFDYFDEVRKLVETAKSELLFVDPYLDAEFVSRYLTHVAQGVRVRLLTRERLPTLLPAIDAFRQQHKLAIEVRSATGFHDRYIFVDGLSCYQSGASFKDGAKKAPTTLTQIVDAFPAMLDTYEQRWSTATVQQ